MGVDDLKRFLEGTWSLERAIRDDRQVGNGVLGGSAAFLPEGNCLLYREIGRLRFGNYDDEVSREYRYSFPEPCIAQVSFADGRPFHDLDLRGGEACVRHLCGNDIYDGVIRTETLNRWSAVWTVSGPRKSLQISSCYQRTP